MGKAAAGPQFRVLVAGSVKKELKKLGRSNAQRILREVEKLKKAPEQYGEPLGKDLAGYWRLVVGGFRVVYKVDHDRVWVMVLAAGKRNEGNIDNIYDWLTGEKLKQRFEEIVEEAREVARQRGKRKT